MFRKQKKKDFRYEVNFHVEVGSSLFMSARNVVLILVVTFLFFFLFI